MKIHIHRVALFLVFQQRIQHSLDEMMLAWNDHKMRGEGNRSPNYIFDASRRKATREGYWESDPGDTTEEASDPLYGVDEQDETSIPTVELEDDLEAGEEVEVGVRVNREQELHHARSLLGEFDYERDDGNWGIEVYLEVVQALAVHYPDEADEALSGGFRM
jgi:hypothetical protein